LELENNSAFESGLQKIAITFNETGSHFRGRPSDANARS
jgi:hypothetical protein